MELTERLDLRGGQPCWRDHDGADLTGGPPPRRTEVAVIGGGITGAMIAWRLADAGREVTLLDRRIPATGGIAASTALVMWAADLPLVRLAHMRGPEPAARTWRRLRDVLLGLDGTVRSLGIDCGWRQREELYLAGTMLDPVGLARERDARAAAGLPSRLLAAARVTDRFGIAPRTALLSDDVFSVDPVALTLGFVARAVARGARLSFPANVTGLSHRRDTVDITLANGSEVRADQVVLATGYEAPRLFLPPAFALGASFAIATAPGKIDRPDRLPMIWEASDSYLYARPTADGRWIVGGGDRSTSDPPGRDALIPAKSGALAVAGGDLLGEAPLMVDCAWAATFGRSPDGLPAIGRARNAERVWLASGFGGNGITFAALAAELIATTLAGDDDDPDAPLFDPYRPFPGT